MPFDPTDGIEHEQTENEHLSITVPKAVADLIESMASEAGVSRITVVRRMIHHCLKDSGHEPPSTLLKNFNRRARKRKPRTS